MEKSKFVSTKAIVLTYTKFKEADKILQIITPVGRFSVLAKGSRKQKSKLVGGTQYFTLNDVTFVQGKSDIRVLTQARLDVNYGNIIKDYDRTQLAFRLLKAVYDNSHSVDSENWFYMIKEALEALNDATFDPKLIETWFYLRLSELLGYEMSLVYDSNGEKIKSGQNYFYNVAEKSLSPGDRGDVTTNHIKLMRILMTNPLRLTRQIKDIDALVSTCLSVSRAHAGV